MKTVLLPSRSYSRSFLYFKKRVLRLNASPHAIAAGVAAGVAASCTPFLGLHFIIAFVLAYVLAGNMIAAAIGTVFGNPITFPIIFGVTHRLGSAILGDSQLDIENIDDIKPIHGLEDIVWSVDLHKLWEPLLKPMITGAIPLAIVFGVASYVMTRTAVSSFRRARARRIARKAEARQRRLAKGGTIEAGRA